MKGGRNDRADGSVEAAELPREQRSEREQAPEQQARHSMELLKNAPMDMGLGIKREAPRHY